MNLGRRGNLDDGGIPTFVFPYSLTFYADDPSTFAQTVHIYNPYPYAIQFKVFSNATHKYNVADSEGVIIANSLADIVIRHSAVFSSNYGKTDKFRIIINSIGQSKRQGKRDISAVLLPTKVHYEDDNSATETERFEQSLPILPSKANQTHQYRILDSEADRGRLTGPNSVFILAAVICMVALMLPNQVQEKVESDLPSYLHLSLSQKLIVAYILGLVTLVLLRH